MEFALQDLVTPICDDTPRVVKCLQHLGGFTPPDLFYLRLVTLRPRRLCVVTLTEDRFLLPSNTHFETVVG